MQINKGLRRSMEANNDEVDDVTKAGNNGDDITDVSRRPSRLSSPQKEIANKSDTILLKAQEKDPHSPQQWEETTILETTLFPKTESPVQNLKADVDEDFLTRSQLGTNQCRDSHKLCTKWISTELCQKIPIVMHIFCRQSCGFCNARHDRL
ncbi:shTK domain protein [Dictyocaulus viviparus]|uniref:ShTK domain protein n=1 Tax=Dictyocaulus viviparus TaxID=29172 RepID=A0A0D8XQ04_DICVI|nr:shTK domain protein [Dictyocaulus viviparus]